MGEGFEECRDDDDDEKKKNGDSRVLARGEGRGPGLDERGEPGDEPGD